MSGQTSKSETGRGTYFGSMIARLDDRDRPVEWWRAPSRWAADTFADCMSVETAERFVVYDARSS